MNRRLFRLFLSSWLAFNVTGCSLSEVMDGAYCPENEDGVYADDSYSDLETGESRDFAMDGDYCNSSYPFCYGDYCVKCSSGTMKVKRNDNQTTFTCLSCKELENCSSLSCQNAKDNNCSKKCRNSTIYDDKEQLIEQCKYGCNDELNGCAEKPKCKTGEVPDENGDCICNVKKNWIGEPGSCKCRKGFDKEGETCIPANVVPNDEDIPDEDISDVVCTNPGEIKFKNETCICDEDNHWTGEPGECKCMENYLLIDGKCEKKIAAISVKHLTRTIMYVGVISLTIGLKAMAVASVIHPIICSLRIPVSKRSLVLVWGKN